MEELTKIPEQGIDVAGARVFMGKVTSNNAKEALNIADELSDMILFHSKVRKNGTKMMSVWGELY